MNRQTKTLFKEALCKKNKFCEWKVVLANDEIQKEVCKFCGRRIFFNKVDGRIDNDRYMRTHVRAFCQPFGITREVYEEIYGKKAIREFYEQTVGDKEKREERIKEYDYEFKKAMEGEKKSTYYGGQTSFK